MNEPIYFCTQSVLLCLQGEKRGEGGQAYTPVPNIYRRRFLFPQLFFPGKSHRG